MTHLLESIQRYDRLINHVMRWLFWPSETSRSSYFLERCCIFAIPMKIVAQELFATLNLLNFPFLLPSFNLYSYNFKVTNSYYTQPVRLPYNFSQIPPTNSSQIHAIPYNFNITPTSTNIPPTNAQMQMGICA